MSNTLLPPNSTPLERHLEQVTARWGDLPVPVKSVLDPASCPAALLPWLAWALAVDEWESSWSEEQKRSVIHEAIFVHRHRGTLGAVKRALSAVGYTIDIREWFDETPPGDPYTFRLDIDVSERGIDLPAQTEILRLVESAKNVRSHVAGLRLSGVSEADLFVGVALSYGTVTDIHPWEGQEHTLVASLHCSATTAFFYEITVHPESP